MIAAWVLATTLTMGMNDPTPEERAAVQAWARRAGLTLSEALGTTAQPLTIDLRIGDEIEVLLAEARDLVAAQDLAQSKSTLARAEALLVSHPELPHAAFLRAELLRIRGTVLATGPDADAFAAARAWQHAAALDGGRAQALGEKGLAASPPLVLIEFSSVAQGARLLWDGRAIDGKPLQVGAGPHQLQVLIEGRAVLARWVDVNKPVTMDVTGAQAPPCSRDDLAAVSKLRNGADAQRVQCTDWLRVERGVEGGTLTAARCRADRCGAAAVIWRRPARATSDRLPSWATWSIVGAAFGAATLLVVTSLLAGAASPVPDSGGFVNGGITVEQRPVFWPASQSAQAATFWLAR